MAAASVSIVIPVFNRLDLTRQCLRKIAEARPRVDHETIVVDNGSTDGTEEWLESQDILPVIIVRNAENLGFSRGCNLGAANARGDVICLLNNDVEVAAGFVDAHLEVLGRDPHVAVVGSRLHYPDGRLQHAGVVLCDDQRQGDPLVAVHRFHGQPRDLAQALVPMQYRAVTAALMSVRRQVWEELGGLDEGFWNGYEDVDFCLRVAEAGYAIVYEPRSYAVHHESASGAERWRAVAANVQRLHERWIGRVPVDVVIHPDGRAEPTPQAGFGPYARPEPQSGAMA